MGKKIKGRKQEKNYHIIHEVKKRRADMLMFNMIFTFVGGTHINSRMTVEEIAQIQLRSSPRPRFNHFIKSCPVAILMESVFFLAKHRLLQCVEF